MVTTRRGKVTEATPASPTKARGKAKAAEKKDASNGSYAEAQNHALDIHGDRKRSAEDTGPAAASEASKRQKMSTDGPPKADLQVKEATPPLQEIPEADTITAAAALDPPAGSGTAVAADDLTDPAPYATDDKIKKPDVSDTSEMPVSEAVKVIGGTKAGSAPVGEAPTAATALDAVPVGPDPAAAGTAADDTPQDGDYFLDANLADSIQGNEEYKPAEQVTAAMGTTDPSKTGFLAPPTSAAPAAPTHTLTDAPPPPAAPTHAHTDTVAGSGMAADVAAAPIDVAPGLQADKGAVTHSSNATGPSDAVHSSIATAPTTVDAHDSHFGAAAAQDAADLPSAVYGGDNA